MKYFRQIFKFLKDDFACRSDIVVKIKFFFAQAA